MRFWDASALTPLLTADSFTVRAAALARENEGMVVWWGTRVECASALARRDRERHGGAGDVGWERLRELADRWDEIAPNKKVRETAVRLLRTHPLRAADALQLAAALAASPRRTQSLDFITFDGRLAEAARKEGLRVLPALP